MAISKQFKLFNLNKKMRKLCIDEIGGVKIEKKVYCNLKKMYFLYCYFLVAPLALHFKNDL